MNKCRLGFYFPPIRGLVRYDTRTQNKRKICRTVARIRKVIEERVNPLSPAFLQHKKRDKRDKKKRKEKKINTSRAMNLKKKSKNQKPKNLMGSKQKT